MSLAAALEIGKAGLRIYQVASEVVSENIANVNTPGYSRQRTILESAPPSTANGFPLGTGVKIATVERYYDALTQKQLVNAGTVSGYNQKKSEVLDQIEPIFNEISQDGLGTAITAFFNAWQDLSVNPTGQTERQGVIGRAQNLVDQFNYVSRTLNDTITLQDEAVSPLVDKINQQIENIAVLNGQIRTTELVYGNANEMRDQRDYLIQQLAENMGVKYTENSDGTTDVYVTDNSAGPPVDYYLVKGALQTTGKVNVAGTPAVVNVTDYLGAGPSNNLDPTAATPFYSSDTSGGTLWATLKMRDVTIPGYLQQVDDLAAQVVTSVNAVHTAGYTPTGVLGGNFFTPAAGATAATITLAITSTTQIAAAQWAGAPTPFAPGDNRNALALAQLKNANTMSGGTTTFSNYYNTLVSTVGLDVQTAQSVVTQDAAFTKQLETLRNSYSGVSLDEELTDLIKYQRSYQASAKLITTVDGMMQALLNMI